MIPVTFSDEEFYLKMYTGIHSEKETTIITILFGHMNIMQRRHTVSQQSSQIRHCLLKISLRWHQLTLALTISNRIFYMTISHFKIEKLLYNSTTFTLPQEGQIEFSFTQLKVFMKQNFPPQFFDCFEKIS